MNDTLRRPAPGRAWMPRSCCLSAVPLSVLVPQTGRTEAQETLSSLRHHPYRYLATWMPRSCSSSDMAGATMSYQLAGPGLSWGDQ